MPLITTHNYFANEVLNDTKNDIKKHFLEKKNIYELFAQGFDLFQFYDFFKLKKENIVAHCHKYNTDTYLLNLIENIKKWNLTNNSEILAALYGHLTHYVLDSNCHPFIVYKTGFYNKKNPQTKKYKGLHSKMEMQIDAYMYERKTQKSFRKFKIHKELITKEKFSDTLVNILNVTYKKTHGINKGGNKYQIGRRNMYYSYKFFIEDSTGIKTQIYKIIDYITPKKKDVFANFSSHIVEIDDKIFNTEHKTWLHPWLENQKSNESFFDLYEKAKKECVLLFEKTDQFIHNQINEDEYKKYLKDKSYVTGLSWNKQGPIQHLEF